MAEHWHARHGGPIRVPVFPVIDPGVGLYVVIHIVFNGSGLKRVTFTRPGETMPWLVAELPGTGFWNHVYRHQDGISRLAISGMDSMPDWTFLGQKKMTSDGVVSAYTCQYLLAESPHESVLVTILQLPGSPGGAAEAPRRVV
ncbi:MAG TPA: hypothetical protein VHI13_08585 [Candidatus Kapabacteria bacterium]|nr:hypothetical protein [Candidatus Kapabacteria bacterium]